MPDELTVAELLKLCSERPANEAAWAEFIRRYNSSIKSFISRACRKARVDPDPRLIFSEETIDDLVQVVYMKLIQDQNRALERFEGEYENSIFKYLGTISKNVVHDYIRELKAGKRPVIVSEILTEPSYTDPEESSIKHEIEQALKRKVTGKKKDRDILIFKLRYYDDLTFNEIKEILKLDISPVSIGSIVTRVVEKIKPTLARARGIRFK